MRKTYNIVKWKIINKTTPTYVSSWDNYKVNTYKAWGINDNRVEK